MFLACDECGAEIKKPLMWKQKGYKHHFCSAKCFHIWNSLRRRKRVKRVCIQCGRVFERIPGHIRTETQGRFCRSSCWGKWEGTHCNPFKNKRHTIETKKLIGQKSRERQAFLPAIKKKCETPNTKEKLLGGILDTYFPKQWRYTGQGIVVINGLVPDFTNCNGTKAVIELYGDYWHTGKMIGRWNRTELGRIMAYNSFGYRCLVIWQSELSNEKSVIGKIKQFTKGGT